MGLRPDSSIQKLLLSSTCRFLGEYETADFLITQAWSGLSSQGTPTAPDLDISRNSFICSFRTGPEDDPRTVSNFGWFGEFVTECLSVLFGKRFDNHGPLENSGMFMMPNLAAYREESARALPRNESKPRLDYPIALNLVEIFRMEMLLTRPQELNAARAVRTFRGAAKFYLRALQSVERDPEFAYLNLITAGEIISNFFDYSKAEVLDDTSKKLIARLREIPEGCKLATHVEGKLRSIKARFVRTIVELVDAPFFDRTQSTHPYAAFKEAEFKDRMRAAYDLRSRYVHTGTPFGHWVARPMIAGGENADRRVPAGAR